MKITKSELQQIIKEEAQRYVEMENLKKRQIKLQEAITRLNEDESLTEEELAEISFGGLKSAFGKVGEKIGGAAKAAGAAVKKGAEDVKQAYQAGAEKEKYEKSQKQISDIASKINVIRKKMEADTAQLQQQYASLTGGKPYKGGAVHKPIMAEGRVIWVSDRD
jgi:septation ring formation regulator EzrA